MHLFLTGIPASGKSHLAKRLAERVGGIHVEIDDIREALHDDARYKKWVNFYLDQDEKTYYTTTNADEQWRNLVEQSEHIWPAILEKVRSYDGETRPVIFEAVNILPHLAKRDLDFPGVVLTGSSYEEILERNIRAPRWGATRELQELEARSFWDIERPRYKAEGEKFGYKVFESGDEAFEYCVGLLKS